MVIIKERNVLWILLFVSSVFLASCSANHAQDGNFLEYTKVVEMEIFDQIKHLNISKDEVPVYASQADYTWHYSLCQGYYRLREYNKFEQCKNSWLQRNDLKELDQNAFIEGFEYGQFLGFEIQLMAQSSLLLAEQGRDEEALNDIEQALNLYRKSFIEDHCRIKPGACAAGNLGHMNYTIYGSIGSAYAKLGNQVGVEQSIRALEESIQRIAELNKKVDLFGLRYLVMLSKIAKGKLLLLLENYYGAINELTDASGNVITTEKSWHAGEPEAIGHTRIFVVARSYFKTGQYSRAKPLYEKLLQTTALQSGQYNFIVLHDLAMIKFKEGDVDNAIQYLKKAISQIEQQRSSLATDTGKVSFVDDKQQVYADLVAILVKKGMPAQALDYAERAKSRALVDLLAYKKSFGFGDNGKNVSSMLEKLSRVEKEEYQKRYAPLEGNDTPRIRSATEAMQSEIKKYSKKLSSVVSVDTLSPKEIQAYLQADETLLELYGKDDFWVAFIVSRNSIKAVTLNLQGVGQKVTLFRQKILDFSSQAYKRDAEKIYKDIFAGVASHIHTNKLIIAAHGPLHYLPFNALHDGDSFLIDRYSIRMLPSASILEFLGQNTSKDDSMLVLANPDLGNAQYDLPAAELEGQAIAKGNARANVLSRKAATETALRKYGPTISRLHIASHGQFKAEAPLKSRLLLAGDNENDGSLTVDELYNLELNNDLVVLSACETGLGDVKNGDDVIGLTRGFLFAGADSIVSSLWVVDDTATANLMVAFYDGLEMNSKQDALRQAQLKIKNEYNEHPFFWAAFQLTGSM